MPLNCGFTQCWYMGSRPVRQVPSASYCNGQCLPQLVLHPKVKSGILGMGRGVEISSSCLHIAGPVEVPQIGCGHCHEFLDFYIQDE